MPLEERIVRVLQFQTINTHLLIIYILKSLRKSRYFYLLKHLLKIFSLLIILF